MVSPPPDHPNTNRTAPPTSKRLKQRVITKRITPIEINTRFPVSDILTSGGIVTVFLGMSNSIVLTI